MSAIQKIFQLYGPEYLERYGNQMPGVHKKAIQDIQNCRSGSFGSIAYSCGCHSYSIPCCCGNRHCPTCQQEKAAEWLQKQMQKALPTHYFLLTITLPQELHKIVRANQQTAYAAMFSCAHEALKKLAKDKRFIGSSKIGHLAVLHTWGSMMQYHPHLHLLIPGGALSENKEEWIPSRQDLFVHTKPFSVIFKAKFMEAMKKARLCDNIDPAIWKKSWVVDSQAVGNGQNSLRYISRYLFRVAISNNRIKSIENNTITFSYKDRRKKKWKTMALDAMEFIRRFLQHVLPKGFMKVRYYGFLNPNFSLAIEKIRELISIIQDVMRTLLPEMPVYKKQQNICKRCGQVPKFIAFLKPTTPALPTPACRGPG